MKLTIGFYSFLLRKLVFPIAVIVLFSIILTIRLIGPQQPNHFGIKQSPKSEETDQIGLFKKQVQKIEFKIARLEGIRKQAIADQDGYAAKIRALGVNSAKDLKDNIRGRGLAENLARLAAEIDGMDTRLAIMETELLKAKSIVRRLEQESASLSDAERRSLSQQLMEVDEATSSGAPMSVPLDVNAAVEKALSGK